MIKSDTEHTPLPWHQGGTNGQELMAPSVIFAADGAAVAKIYGVPLNCKLDEVDSKRYAEGLANVATVLEAVNSHAALIEAARALRLMVKDCFTDQESLLSLVIGNGSAMSNPENKNAQKLRERCERIKEAFDKSEAALNKLEKAGIIL